MMAKRSLARFHWQISGQVQGVGFRPFVFRRAEACGLSGVVRNDLRGVSIEAQGKRELLEQFDQALRRELPPLASIESIACQEVGIDSLAEPCFSIESSHSDGPLQNSIATDTSVCHSCLQELLAPANRRAGYALTNCTNCGPRFTIMRAMPYDRHNTTMGEFAMCSACRSEYTSPHDRRFHAQPICCHDCGPTLTLVDCQGEPVAGDPIDEAVRALRRSAIVAIKGLGGFHLAVRADNLQGVARLRRLKLREAKPFALMCRSLHEASTYVQLSRSAASALQSPVRPIVLAVSQPGVAIAENVAPGVGVLGVMLPYTPIHHLLFAADPGIGPLVMTSGNLGDEPLVISNAEALERIGGLCDLLLWHDRAIERRVDDSVLRDMGSAAPLPIRRARGFVPRGIKIPRAPPKEVETGLCVGGELKNTIALVRGSEVILSQHLGDLKHPLAWAHFQHTITDLLRLYQVHPQWIACDLHPAYLSSIHAARLAQQWGARLLRVQHHHAHAAALMAEHQRLQPVLAVVCDGVGYGADGTIWGGELLIADLHSARRVARLRPMQLAGGDAAAIDTRRCALALLQHVVGGALARHRLTKELYPDPQQRVLIAGMVKRGVRCVSSSAAGRLFDGFAALIGLCRQNRFEAESGMQLEAAAREASRVLDSGRLFSLRQAVDDPSVTELDFAPLIQRTIALQEEGSCVADLSLLFHIQLAEAWDAAVTLAAQQTDIGCVALSGGVFCNRLLTELLTDRLTQSSLQVLRHSKAPPNDGGLALGQAAVAAARLHREHLSARCDAVTSPASRTAPHNDCTQSQTLSNAIG